MKVLSKIVFIFALLGNLNATEIQGQKVYPNFDKAKESGDLTWIVESTKVGIFSSDVDGYVLNYQYSANYDEKNNILRNMVLRFPIKHMNSDNDTRDEKLHNLCLNEAKFKEIVVKIPGPLFLNQKSAKDYSGSVLIRGKEKPFTISLSPKIEKDLFQISGETTWSLKEMEIPDPSIAVATLSDEIRIKINIKHSLK